MTELQSTARLASVVYAPPPAPDDPAELYHEASKLAEATAGHELAGARRLAASSELRRAAARASLRHEGLPLVPLGDPEQLTAPLGKTIASRRSVRGFAPAPLRLGELAALLGAGYGLTGVLEDEEGWHQPLRSVPSGGALYPLDLYVAAARVEGLPAGVYRYEPLEGGLEAVGGAAGAIAAATAYPELAASASVTVVVAATFWRARFKYSLRAYRFTLLEAGHVAQNVLLAATALELGAVPLGGFWDRRLDEELELDGVDRSSLYVLCVGRRNGAC